MKGQVRNGIVERQVGLAGALQIASQSKIEAAARVAPGAGGGEEGEHRGGR